MKSNRWENPYEVEKIINNSHHYSSLNMRAVTKCIQDNQWYTEDILEKRRQIELERERLRREEELYRKSLDRVTINEHQRLIKRRDEYLRYEKDIAHQRLERIRLEKERIRKQKEEEAERIRQ